MHMYIYDIHAYIDIYTNWNLFYNNTHTQKYTYDRSWYIYMSRSADATVTYVWHIYAYVCKYIFNI